MRSLIILGGILVAAGCGFHLRGSDISTLESVHLNGPAAHGDIYSVFVDVLAEHDVSLAAESADGLTVTLLDERLSSSVASTSAAIDAAGYALVLEVDISISRGGKSLLSHATLVSTGTYEVDSQNLVGSYEERNLLLKVMRRDQARHMIRRVEAVALRGAEEAG